MNLPGIHLACLVGNRDLVEACIARGTPLDLRDEFGRTPLMLACRSGAFDVVRYLIERGASVVAQNDTGTTPLMYAKTWAMGARDTKLLDLLIAAGADVNQKDHHARTALSYAEEGANIVISYLTGRGAVH